MRRVATAFRDGLRQSIRGVMTSPNKPSGRLKPLGAFLKDTRETINENNSKIEKETVELNESRALLEELHAQRLIYEKKKIVN